MQMSNSGSDISGSHSCSNSVLRRLRRKLQQLEFGSFQQCVWLWLAASGFRNMLTFGREHRRGRRRVGGADFLVQVAGETDLSIVVQVRHWQTPVTRRAVDELRGYLLRNDIGAGMIVSSSLVSRAAREAASEFHGRPIRLVGVDRLASSMAALDLGISRWPMGDFIDHAFFRTVGRLRFASSSPARPKTARAKSSAEVDPIGPPRNASDYRLRLGLVVLVVLVDLLAVVLWIGGALK